MQSALRCLKAISNHGLTGELPTRIKLLNWGATESQVGPVLVNERTQVALAAQIANRFFDRIVVDFEHSSEPGHPNFQKPPREHAAYGTIEIVGGDGVYLGAIEWTPAGRKYAREYADLSPTVRLEKDGTVAFLKSVALVPNGAVADLSFFGADANTNSKEQGIMEKFLAAIRRGLGLKDEADEAEVQGAVMALAALTAKAAALEAELGAVKALAATPPGELATLQAKTTELEGRVATLSAEIDKRDREHVLERARWEGKVVSLAAEVVEKMSVAELAEHVAKIESTVPLAARTPGAVQEPRDGQITEADRSIARACGLDPAKMAAK